MAASKAMNEDKSQTESFPEEQALEPDAEPPEPTLAVQIADEQSALVIDPSQIQRAVQQVFGDSAYSSGSVSIAVVDDLTIHEINRQYLQHDYPTDVLSFVLEDRKPYLEGELVVSADTAIHNAAEYNWPAESELLLYVIHGALHLVGFRDKEPNDIVAMREAEKKCLHELGIAVPRGSTRWSPVSKSNETIDEEPSS